MQETIYGIEIRTRAGDDAVAIRLVEGCRVMLDVSICDHRLLAQIVAVVLDDIMKGKGK